MAKVGNEAKLILRLARERTKDFGNEFTSEEAQKTYKAGICDYASMLDAIVKELES